MSQSQQKFHQRTVVHSLLLVLSHLDASLVIHCIGVIHFLNSNFPCTADICRMSDILESPAFSTMTCYKECLSKLHRGFPHEGNNEDKGTPLSCYRMAHVSLY